MSRRRPSSAAVVTAGLAASVMNRRLLRLPSFPIASLPFCITQCHTSTVYRYVTDAKPWHGVWLRLLRYHDRSGSSREITSASM